MHRIIKIRLRIVKLKVKPKGGVLGHRAGEKVANHGQTKRHHRLKVSERGTVRELLEKSATHGGGWR